MPVFNDVVSGIQFTYTYNAAIGDQPIPSRPMVGGEYLIQSATATFSGKVTAQGPLVEVAEYEAGFIQELRYMSRIARYTQNIHTKDRNFEVAPNGAANSMRDGSGEVPFDGGGCEKLANGVQVDIESSDEPGLEVPLYQTANGIVGDLIGTSGRDEFSIWLVAVRQNPPKRIVVLSRIDWFVHYNSQVTLAPWSARLNVDPMPMVQPAQQCHSIIAHPGPGNVGEPQDMTDREANDYLYRIYYHKDIVRARHSDVADPTEPPANFFEFPGLPAVVW